jgi:hypothetical protein
VRDDDDGAGGVREQRRQIAEKLLARGGVETGERLVEERELSLEDQSTGERAALGFAAGECAGIAVKDLRDAAGGGHGADAGLSFWARDATQAQGEVEVRAQSAGEEQRVLEGVGDEGARGTVGADRGAADGDAPGGGVFERGYRTEERAFAGAIWPEDGSDRIAGDRERRHIEDEAAATVHTHVFERNLHQRGRRCWVMVSSRFTTNAMTRRIRPRAIARSFWPRAVSVTMAVVRTRVSPWRLPPTVMEAPTSETTAPKPAMMAARRPRWASRARSQRVRRRPAPRRARSSGNSRGSAWTAAAVNPMTSGVAMRNWAMTIARFV